MKTAWRYLLFFSALSLSAASPSFAGDDSATVPMLSGGVGEEEYDYLQQAKEHFNVKLLFVEESGAYLSDVRVVVSTPKGVEIASTTTEGPVLLLRLKPGNYEVKARVAGVTKALSLIVYPKKMSKATIRFPVQDHTD